MIIRFERLSKGRIDALVLIPEHGDWQEAKELFMCFAKQAEEGDIFEIIK